MNNHPAEIKPTAAFAQAMDIQPSAAVTGQFKLSLSSNGVQLGWLGQDGGGWGVLATEAKDALTLELYPYNGVSYYRIKGTSKYMSVGTVGVNNGYIGFYGWAGARGFTRKGTHLVSDLNGQSLSLFSKDNGYIYAWDAYTILDVAFQPV